MILECMNVSKVSLFHFLETCGVLFDSFNWEELVGRSSEGNSRRALTRPCEMPPVGLNRVNRPKH